MNNNTNNNIPSYAEFTNNYIRGFFGPFRFLSNMYKVSPGVWLDELLYPTTENAYQAAKWPIEKRHQFLTISPYEAKQLGKIAPGFKAKQWDKKKYPLMFELVKQKFTNDLQLREMLILTEDLILEEKNAWGDSYWGTDLEGMGENNLGKILMLVRSHVRDLTKKESDFKENYIKFKNKQ